MGDFCRFFHIRTTPSKTALSLAPHQPFHNRTIPLAFRRGGARSSCCIDPLHFYNLCKRTLITCLARPSRCTEYCHPHNHCKRTIIPRPALNLPPLSKGGGLTAKHKLLLCCVLLATRPPFYSLNFSAVKTEGLLYHPSLSTTSMSPLPKVRCCRPKKIGRLPEGLPHRHPLPCTNPSKTALSLAPHHPCLPCQR